MNMDRRLFAKTLAAPLFARALAASQASPERKPNLLYVFSDQHRACSLPGQLYSDVRAPTLTRLKNEGVSFRNCISNYPVCSPYRAMLLTGRWPYQTGIIDNALQLRSDETSLAKVFAGAGYCTGYIGKWHLSPGGERGVFIPKGPARQGFDDWHVWSNTGQHFDKSFTFDPDTGARIQPKGYNATLMTDTAIEFIRNYRDRPWMLMLSWNPPHTSFEDAPPEYVRRYDPAALRLRPNVPAESASGRQKFSREKVRHSLQGYYAHISALDAELSRLLSVLDQTGLAGDTIVVYTTDHGDMLGSHGFYGKRVPWEESCKVPFFVRYPGVVPAGRESDGLFSAIDIYPTLCGLAGLNVPSHCAGHDLSGAVRGDAMNTPESAFLMHIKKDNATGGNDNPAPLFRGIRTARYTYAVAEDGAWRLYDNIEDPYQLRNMIDLPQGAKLAHDLDGLVLEWLKKAGDPFPYQETCRKRSSLDRS
jgi:arylsulfatase A-like enzyme